MCQRLAAAARWLFELHDPHSGRLPNLGPNDGTMLFPLSTLPHDDYRPLLQAAFAAFLGQWPFLPGSWDEPSLWLGLSNRSIQTDSGGQTVRLPSDRHEGQLHGLPSQQSGSSSVSRPSRTPHTLRSSDDLSWAYLRLAHFTSRPGHADQLHLDLWWRGLNLAQDAGTYLYNGLSPWDNPLVETGYHNTLTVDYQGQMPRAGRFLFLDWAQARLLSQDDRSLIAQHDGFRSLGLVHQRTVTLSAVGLWSVQDELLPSLNSRPSNHTACLHWLLPDWEFKVDVSRSPDGTSSRFLLQLASPQGFVKLSLEGGNDGLQIVRAGQLLYGTGPANPTWGWVSPTYSVKIPALALRLAQVGNPPISFKTLFTLPG